MTENLDKSLEKVKKFMQTAKNYLSYEELIKELISNFTCYFVVGNVKIVDVKDTRHIRIAS